MYQRLGSWLESLDGNSAAIERGHSLLQRAYQAFVFVAQCEAIQEIALTQFQGRFSQLEGAPNKVHAWSPAVAKLLVDLSASLAALRLLQNETWQFTASAFNIKGAPQSLHDAYNTMRKSSVMKVRQDHWVNVLPAEVASIFMVYWDEQGKLLASYRDVDQRHSILARNCFLDCGSQAFSRLWVCLPDNPDDKSLKKFTYIKNTDGIELAIQQINTLHHLLDGIAQSLGFLPQPIKQSINFSPAITLEDGAIKSTAILLLDELGTRALALGQNEERRVTIRNC